MATPFPPGMPDMQQQQPEPPVGLDEALQVIREAARQAMQDNSATPDIEHMLEKIATDAAAISALLHKEQQAAIGGGPATNYIRRTTGG